MEKEKGLAKKVRSLREGKGWTQAHLAQVSGIDERTIRRIEAGSTPSLDTLQALAQAFEVDCGELRRHAKEDPKPKANVQLIPISTGREFFAAIGGAHAGAVDADDAENKEEAELVKSLLDLMEYAEIWDDIPPSGRYDAEQQVSNVLRELNARSWGVCAERRRGTVQTPAGPIPNWLTVRLRVARVDAELARAFREGIAEVRRGDAGPADRLH